MSEKKLPSPLIQQNKSMGKDIKMEEKFYVLGTALTACLVMGGALFTCGMGAICLCIFILF